MPKKLYRMETLFSYFPDQEGLPANKHGVYPEQTGVLRKTFTAMSDQKAQRRAKNAHALHCLKPRKRKMQVLRDMVVQGRSKGRRRHIKEQLQPSGSSRGYRKFDLA